MAVPEVGALVEATLIGEVRAIQHSGAILLRVGKGFEATDHLLPLNAAVKTLVPPCPREVLLLECGHVSGERRPTSPSGTVYCWRYPCQTDKAVARVGSVNW